MNLSFEATSTYNKINNEADNVIEPNSAKTHFLDYKNETTHLTIQKTKENDFDLQINIYSIDCNIEVIYPSESIKKKAYFNIYSLIINSTTKDIYIRPLKDIEEGEFKENYENKSCILSINSYYISNNTQQTLKIKNKESNFVYFSSEFYTGQFNFFYEINNLSNNSFVSLNFIIQSSLDIDITCINNNNQKENTISKYINDDSNFIYLDSDFLLSNSNIGDDISLYINIKNIKQESTLFFKVMEENNICLLSKNKLNFGFLTSKTTNQYYYTEVLQGEEGELMIHNKRNYGVLYAKIINKTDKINIYDIAIYPHINETMLEYNGHKLRLKFNYENTENCFNGCYLLITYEQNKSKDDFPTIGYEYTILSRFWNKEDYTSKIIDLLYNEYYISCFEQGSSSEHYYSIYIPNDAEKIIIQLEGNYFQAFYEEGRKKINTKNPKAIEIEFEMNDENKKVFILDIKNLNLSKEKIISFAFRPKDYFSNIFSYYYFRVLYTKKSETKYLPMDSNFGNLCLPEKNSSISNYFYCYLILKNDYNELNTGFAISSTNHYEHVKLYITRIYKNNTESKTEETYFNYVNDEIIDNIDRYLIIFEFTNNEINNIISSFCDKIEEIYPQVYSVQMFYLKNFRKINNFKLKNYYLNYQFISGEEGSIYFPFEYYIQLVNISPNFKQTPILFPIIDNLDQYQFSSKLQHIFYFQLIYGMKTKGTEEIKSKEPLTQLLEEIYFPLYYYIKIKNKYYINMDVTLKFKNYRSTELNNIYTMKGYIVKEDIINRKINGEYIKFDEPIIVNYSDAFGIGLLHLNQKAENNETDNYLLIEINCLNKQYMNPNGNSMVEISAKEYDEKMEYILLLNKYIIETFDTKNGNVREKNEYYIFSPEGNKMEIFVEINTDDDDIELVFKNCLSNYINDEAGFKKYKIIKKNYDDGDKLNLEVKNKNKRNAKYILKYSYYNVNTTNSFSFDVNYTINYTYNNDTVDISLTFNKTKVDKSSLEKGIYLLITGSLYKDEELSNEIINYKYILNEKEPIYKNKTTIFYHSSLQYNNPLIFTNISRDNNHIYDLQLQINAFLLNDFLYEQFFVYSTKVDLTGIREKNNNNYIWNWVVISIIIIIIIFLVAFFIIKFLRLKKKNDNLQKEIKALEFSNDMKNTVLIKELKISKKESDFETTFI